MSDFQFLKFEVQNRIATLTLNRPEVYNAFNNELSFEMHEALRLAAKDQEIRVLVITGEGKAFSSGQDLKASASAGSRSLSESILKRYNPMIRMIRQMPKPVIARVNGVAAGAGCSLALACDIIVAAEEATLIEIFINIGLVLDSGSSFFLPRSVPYQKAFEWATMAPKITATQAFEMGLVNRVAPLVSLDQAVSEYAGFYASAPTKAVGLMKKMLNKAANSDLDTMLDYEAYCQEIAGRSHDHKEGVKAFGEKRKPMFEGR